MVYFYCILFLDGEGDDHILVETANDLYIIIQMNKAKCLAGQSIPLYVMDFLQSTDTTIVSPTDSKV